jgi:hypothetical protein
MNNRVKDPAKNFAQSVQEQFDKFERLETRMMNDERRERAQRLRLPLHLVTPRARSEERRP